MRGTVDLRRLIGDLREADGNVTFVIGAGASITAGIPLASKLVEEILARYPRRLDGLSESERANYGRVMGCLAPAQREELVSPYLERAKLNWGHIALASLIAESKVKRVLTFNFDLILEKALALLGRHVAVYDFGMMPTKQINRLVEPSIVHLHGQGYGMKLLNSEEETRAHCENLRPLFGTALRESLTVVFGYGGKSDPVLDVMTAEYDSRYPLYWLGHDDAASEHLALLLATEDATYLGGCDFDRVMTRVAEGLEAWPPSILANPMRHVREVLAPTTDYPVGDEAAVDILREARRRLAEFETDWETNRTLEQRALESSMGSPEGEAGLEGGDFSNLSEAARLSLAWRHVDAGNGLMLAAKAESGKVARQKYASAARRFEEALAAKPDMHEALNNWGVTLVGMSRHLPAEAALASLRKAVEKYSQALAVKADYCVALANWGTALFEMSKHLPADAGKAVLREAGEKYAEALALEPGMPEAHYSWGLALAKYSKHLPPAEALAALQRAGEKYEQAVARKPDHYEALGNWGTVLLEMSKHLPADSALLALRKAAEKFAQALAVKPDMHAALHNWGTALGEMSELLPEEEALAALREAAGNFTQALVVKPDFHEALHNWVYSLCKIAALSTGDERSEALDKAEEVLSRYHALTGKTSPNLARVHALRGDAAKAIAALEACRRDGGLPDPAHLDTDTDLDSIRDDPAYRAFRAGLEPSPTAG